MTRTHTPQAFGEAISVRRLNSMAQNIARHIDGGRPVSYAGFLWYRPQGLFQRNLHHAPVEQPVASRLAA